MGPRFVMDFHLNLERERASEMW